MTDNGAGYRSFAFKDSVEGAGGRQQRIPPFNPQINGKVERFNRTLFEEWAYVRIHRSESARRAALDRWLHTYNHHRCHTALRGEAPISRVNNVPGHYS